MFERPVTITLDGQPVQVANVAEARDLLMSSWPEERGPRHRDALETCLKVIDGHRSIIDAETRFREAAVEAGILAENSSA